MRTGAIFARGSCRALKWMAVFGVVFALGAGQALAQGPEIDIRSVTVGGRTTNTVPEGQLLTVTVTLDTRVPRTATGVNSVVVTLAEGVLNASNAFTANPGDLGAMGWAETDDVVIPNMTITIGEQQTSGSASFVTGRDADAVNEKFRIQATADQGTGSVTTTTDPGHFTVASDASGMFAGTIDDAEEQTYELKLDTSVIASKPMENGNFDVTLRAVPARPDNEFQTAFMYLETGDVTGYSYLNPTDNSEVTGVHQVVVGSGSQNDGSQGALIVDLRVMAPLNDKNRTDDTIMLDAYTGSAGRNEGVATLAVEVADIHMLPDADAISAEARDEKKYADGEMITSVMEGSMAYVFIMVENTLRDQVADDEKFSVSLSAANSSQLLDFKVTPSSITVPSRDEFTLPSDDSEMIGPFTLEALMDEDIGAETLMLNIDLTTAEPAKGYGSGSSAGMFSIMLEDTTMPMVWAKSQEEIEAAVYAAKGDGPMYPGDSFEIMTADLFDMAEGVMVAFSATSDSAAASAAASASMVTVMGVEMGMAHITVTGTATMPSGAKPLPQTMSNIAQVIFPVEVMDRPMTYMLSGPEDMNIVEGGMGAMLTVTANQAVAMDTEVMVMRDRAMSTAGDDDYMLDPMMITIMAGEMMGSTMVMAVEDDMMENMNNMPEELVLFAMVGDMDVEGSVKLYVWDMAVPALPLIAQLLLGLFLALGGYRRYLRR